MSAKNLYRIHFKQETTSTGIYTNQRAESAQLAVDKIKSLYCVSEITKVEIKSGLGWDLIGLDEIKE